MWSVLWVYEGWNGWMSDKMVMEAIYVLVESCLEGRREAGDGGEST